jgi:UDP-N-acetylmuramoylalanine--D-glutamate ligase
LQRLDSFQRPQFRCELIHQSDQLMIINDSKSTNMASTLSAVVSYESPIILILSGQPKESFSDEWMQIILDRCVNIYACGYLFEHPECFPIKGRDRIQFFSDLKQTVRYVLDAHDNGLILFSPAGASFDAFKNYEERGAVFNQYVFESI